MELKMVQVWPKNETMRKILKHPHNNVSFPAEGTLDWPDDTFTHRRVTDGDIVLEDPSPSKEQPAAQSASAAPIKITPPSGGKTK